MGLADPRRLVPRTDEVLADPLLAGVLHSLGRETVKTAVRRAQDRVREGELRPSDVARTALQTLPTHPTSLRPVINATGVVLHTNLGRAPLSERAVDAVRRAAGYVDVEYDLTTGRRAGRGRATLDALRAAVPGTEDALVVNNGAAALVLATTALAAGRDVVISRGEMVEIGDGFRLPDLIASTGARLREVGTTNRTSLQDYADAVGPQTGCLLKVHPSNFRLEGFTSSVTVDRLATLGVLVVVDIGSGLLRADPLLPGEPDATSALAAGASVVTASGDKLLGGPQAGLVLGRADLVQQLRRHPLARALRVDKLTLAALEATLTDARTPVAAYLHADPDELRRRTEALAARLGGDVDVDVVASAGAVGGGGAPGLQLLGWAVALPPSYAEALRVGQPTVVARIEQDRCLVDLRCVPASDDLLVQQAIEAVRT